MIHSSLEKSVKLSAVREDSSLLRGWPSVSNQHTVDSRNRLSCCETTWLPNGNGSLLFMRVDS